MSQHSPLSRPKVLNGEMAERATNGTQVAQNGNVSLKVIIIGAGIGGLAAAIALRKQGHQVVVRDGSYSFGVRKTVLIIDVQLLEQSRFAQELGAAVHLAPNSNGILRRLGIYAEAFGADTMNVVRGPYYTLSNVVATNVFQFTECKADSSLVRSVPTRPHLWQHVSISVAFAGTLLTFPSPGILLTECVCTML